MEYYDYIHRDSAIHKLDPRTKMLWLIGLTALVFITNKIEYVFIAVLILLFTIILSKLPIRIVWQSSRIFIIFFTIGYIVLFTLLLSNLRQGLVEGLIFSIKFLVLVESAILFAMVTSQRDLLLSLVKMKVPYEFAFVLTLSIRFIPVIIKEFNNVVNAQKTRAHKMFFSIKKPAASFKSFIPVLIPTLFLLMHRAFELSVSAEARAFRSSNKRTFPKRLNFRLGDYVLIIALVILLVLSVL